LFSKKKGNKNQTVKFCRFFSWFNKGERGSAFCFVMNRKFIFFILNTRTTSEVNNRKTKIVILEVYFSPIFLREIFHQQKKKTHTHKHGKKE
jgi:hypothetical protein